MRSTRRRQRGTPRWYGSAFLLVACSLGWCRTSVLVVLPPAAAAAAAASVDTPGESGGVRVEQDDIFDEDAIVRETIAAGRGDREERGIRDQWLSDEHIGEGSQFDSRKPVSAEVKRLLRAYGLSCEDCDHDRAVRTVNAYVRETKRRTRLEREARERRDSTARRVFGALVVIGLSVAYTKRKELGLEFLFRNGAAANGNANGNGRPAADVLRRRQQAADAASRRKQEEQRTKRDHQPTWLDNEKKEVWTAKQEKQFQKALREFAGVRKNERYKLIAEKVHGKSRIECLTHHRMQELLAKQQQQEQAEEK